jgi:hypothetical protein
LPGIISLEALFNSAQEWSFLKRTNTIQNNPQRDQQGMGTDVCNPRSTLILLLLSSAGIVGEPK